MIGDSATLGARDMNVRREPKFTRPIEIKTYGKDRAMTRSIGDQERRNSPNIISPVWGIPSKNECVDDDE